MFVEVGFSIIVHILYDMRKLKVHEEDPVSLYPHPHAQTRETLDGI